MNAFFSFDLFMVYIPECNQQVRLWNNTCRYWEILHNLNLGCSFIILRELCNNQWPRYDIAWLHVANLYTTVFWVKHLSNLTLYVRLFNRLIGKPWYQSYGTYEMSSNYWELEKVGLHNKIHSYRSKMKLWDARGTSFKNQCFLTCNPSLLTSRIWANLPTSMWSFATIVIYPLSFIFWFHNSMLSSKLLQPWIVCGWSILLGGLTYNDLLSEWVIVV